MEQKTALNYILEPLQRNSIQVILGASTLAVSSGLLLGAV